MKVFVVGVWLAHMGIAAADAVTDNPYTYLAPINIGLAGLALFAFVKGWVYPGRAYKELQEILKARDQELLELRLKLEDQILPELIRAREQQERVAVTMDKFIRFVEKVGRD